MRKTILVLVFATVLGIGTTVFATNDNGNGNTTVDTGTASSTSGNSNSSSTGSSVQTQTQTQTNNPGIGTMTQTQAEVQLQDRIQDSEPEYSPKNAGSQERMSAVATATENLVRVAERVENEGVGDQIRTIARTQSENCDNINQSIDRVQERTSFAYFFAGANYSELKNVQTLMEQNRNQIEELEQLMAQVTVEADKLEIANQIIVLQNQQFELRDQVRDITSGFSLFGWLNRWIRGVTV